MHINHKTQPQELAKALGLELRVAKFLKDIFVQEARFDRLDEVPPEVMDEMIETAQRFARENPEIYT